MRRFDHPAVHGLDGAFDDIGGFDGHRPAPFGGWLSPWDWDHLRHEVSAETRVRIAVLGPQGAGKRRLVGTLCGWAPAAGDDVDPAGGTWDDHGLFQIVDVLPAGRRAARPGSGASPVWAGPGDVDGAAAHEDRGGPDGQTAGPWAGVASVPDERLLPSPDDIAADSDLVVFVVDRPRAGDPELRRAFSRLRAIGRPMITVVSTGAASEAGVTGGGPTGPAAIDGEAHYGPQVVLDVAAGGDLARRLVPMMVDANPGIAVALGREAALARPIVTDRLVRRAALVALITGLEPIPLVDVPIQLAGQMKLLARLATAHGHAGGDGERAVMASLGGGLAGRYAFQQLAKLVPISGWIVSGLLGGLTTWMLGQVAAAHFAGRLALPVRRWPWRGGPAPRRRRRWTRPGLAAGRPASWRGLAHRVSRRRARHP